jgi:GMP synthase-like glutamine amidotransferase
MRHNHTIRIAILDLYDNLPNQGMRCIQELIADADGKFSNQAVAYDVFETRYKAEIPGLEYDIYISTGGPGSPFDGEGKDWENKFFNWWRSVWEHNQKASATSRKHVLAICHSFQMMVRFFDLGEVTMRHTKSFGLQPIYKTSEGQKERLYHGLSDPFYAADFRDWQVVQPKAAHLETLGAQILALEEKNGKPEAERSIMGIRMSPEIVGLQFHPEADPASMLFHARKPERRQHYLELFGIEKYEEFLRRLEDPNYLQFTRKVIIPRFLRDAIFTLRPELSIN